MDTSFLYVPENRLLIIVGNFGSGKTEVSVNLALALAESHPVQIVDLDIVNPYFRCREAREEMEARGIRVVYPQGEYHSADLPIILPEVRGVLAAKEGFVILDVGGDDLGARVLSSLADLLEDREYTMLQVINTRRPFTRDVEGCLKIKAEIEAASRLSVTGFIANTHLMDETVEATILEGLEVAGSAAKAAGVALGITCLTPFTNKCLPRFCAGAAVSAIAGEGGFAGGRLTGNPHSSQAAVSSTGTRTT